MAEFDLDNLRLTDFVDLATLQEIQDSFTAVANVKAVITDAEGTRLTHPTPTTDFLRRQRARASLLSGIPAPPTHQRADGGLHRDDDALGGARRKPRAPADGGDRLRAAGRQGQLDPAGG